MSLLQVARYSIKHGYNGYRSRICSYEVSVDAHYINNLKRFPGEERRCQVLYKRMPRFKLQSEPLTLCNHQVLPMIVKKVMEAIYKIKVSYEGD